MASFSIVTSETTPTSITIRVSGVTTDYWWMYCRLTDANTSTVSEYLSDIEGDFSYTFRGLKPETAYYINIKDIRTGAWLGKKLATTIAEINPWPRSQSNVDWHASMQQTFEYYLVDPGTWRDTRKLDNVTSCSITRDSEAATLGSATIDITESVGEAYVRVYLVTIQNGVKERHALGTYLIQTPSSSFDGKVRTVSMDAYTPLLELKDTQPPIGYYLPKNENILKHVYRLTQDHARAPAVQPSHESTFYADFVADPDDTWLSYLGDAMADANYEYGLDEQGRILFMPKQDAASLQPIWTFDDSNSSILYPDFNMEHDLFDVPNVVEIVYSTAGESYYARVVNDDPNSPTSTVNRGREIVHRESNPSLDNPSEEHIKEYARQTLRDMSTLEYSISYTHGYCPVRLGDCVRLNYERAGIVGIKAKVVSQNIKCEPGCPVSEKAVFTTKLWG
jgi:hypothetical protein